MEKGFNGLVVAFWAPKYDYLSRFLKNEFEFIGDNGRRHFRLLFGIFRFYFSDLLQVSQTRSPDLDKVR